ncbi:MAG: Ig-like domain-containing protein, partial [Candidatus Diapherotrites archaeon]
MKPQRKPRLTCRKAISALILLFISLAFTTQAFALGPVLDVNATGANFEVGTKDFNLFFEQYYGGGITKIVDLNRDGRLKTNLASSNGISAAYTTNEFDFWYGTIGLDRRIADDDNSARLWKAEDLGSRAQIMASGALMDWNCAGAPKFDLNFTKTSTIYPIPGGLKVAVHLEFTDTNSAATNYAGSFANGFSLQNSGTFTYTDNNVSAPAGSEWWYAVQRYDLNSDYDANTAIARGYAKRAADSSFYNKKWDPVYAQVLISANMNGWFASSGLSQQFNAGETDYINYLLYFTSTRELGQRVNFSIPNSDENLIDYRMLDYRNPDDLFAKTGDFNYFDYNTGAYVLTADNNRVDFNISTNGIYNDHNNWDTNRYYPAFQIDSYFGSTAPVVKKNNTLLTQGIDYVSDVNTEGNYAVVVWLGALTGDDENAQFVMAEDLTAPSLTISSPSPGSSTASNSMNIKYSATDASGIKKYYIRMDGGEWLDNNFNITKNYPNLGAGEHTADVIAVDYADNNSATESVTFTLTAPALTVRYLDVNATGDNFEVGTVDFNMFFEQSKGGGIMGLADLNRDSVRKNLIETNLGNWHSMDAWFAADPAGGWREDVDDNAAQLWNAEDLNSRVKITASGALTRWGPAGQSISGTSGQIYDLNYVKTTTIYPIIGGFRAVVHNEFTDTNTAATNYGGFYHRFHLNPSIGIYTYQDNNLTGYFTGMAWWRAVQRTDLNSDFDTNAVMICGYDKFSTQRFFNGKWGPLSFNSNWGTSSTVGWYDADLSPEFSSGEMSYLNYVIVLTDTKQFGQVYPGIKSAADENLVDYYMLDYRNPDDLFMTTGTFQEFDFNTGAYLLNASHNAVDFNIAAANTQLTDHNTTDVNRYSPAFEIRNYTAITKPQLKYNGTLMTEGLEFVSDVNTSADYAVIVWLG